MCASEDECLTAYVFGKRDFDRFEGDDNESLVSDAEG